VADIVLALFLFSPLRRSAADEQRALQQAQSSLAAKQKDVAPLLGMDQKLARSESQVAAFMRDHLPAHGSEIAAELGKLAQANGVRLAGARYMQKPSTMPDVVEVTIDAGLEGDYVNSIKFINALERDKMFFILNGVSLTEEKGGSVRLTLNLQTLLRTS
jgi:type IV pilus assembly protein PilO